MQHFKHCELQSRFNELKIKMLKKDPKLEDYELEHLAWQHLTEYINLVVTKAIEEGIESDSEEEEEEKEHHEEEKNKEEQLEKINVSRLMFVPGHKYLFKNQLIDGKRYPLKINLEGNLMFDLETDQSFSADEVKFLSNYQI